MPTIFVDTIPGNKPRRVEAIGDQAKLRRRQEIHQLDKQIWARKEEIKALALAIDLMCGHGNLVDPHLLILDGCGPAISVLGEEGKARTSEIKRLQEQKKELKG